MKMPVGLVQVSARTRVFGVMSAAIAAFSLVGCPAKAPAPNPSPVTEVMVVKGDPNELIQGARLNGRSPFNEQNISELNQYSLLSLIEYVEKEKTSLAAKDQSQIEKENAPKEEPKQSGSTELLRVKVEAASSGQWRMQLLGGVIAIDLKKDASGDLQPYRVSSKNEVFALEPVHWSVSRDGSFMSVLLRTEDTVKGKSLVALYFERPPRNPAAAALTIGRTNQKYQYIAGPGVKLGWRIPSATNSTDALQIRLCGGSAAITPMVKQAVEKWKTALGNRLKIEFAQQNQYAPFSDLNEHCIYMIEAYISQPNPTIANYGATILHSSVANATIADADIFIFKSEFNKTAKALAEQKGISFETAKNAMTRLMPLVFAHELGHLLGLDHKFDGTPSLMSYEFKHSEPQPYDIEAIQALYSQQ